MNSVLIYMLTTLPHYILRRINSDNENGEGVVSAAIAVVIFSALGVAMWLAFRSTMNTATSMVNSQVSQLGN